MSGFGKQVLNNVSVGIYKAYWLPAIACETHTATYRLIWITPLGRMKSELFVNVQKPPFTHLPILQTAPWVSSPQRSLMCHTPREKWWKKYSVLVKLRIGPRIGIAFFRIAQAWKSALGWARQYMSNEFLHWWIFMVSEWEERLEYSEIPNLHSLLHLPWCVLNISVYIHFNLHAVFYL